ncbi:MAG TPA: glycosyltransferase family 9 protein [Alphaproteobacteria bacterium]|nr:glycosyltransferase family 9 protein [Alphaproteobacteria bacterium]
MRADPATILVYSGLELMGDGFMKLPFLRALRGTWPSARITWLAGRGKTVYAGPLRPLVQSYLDEIIEDAGVGLALGELLRRPLSGRSFDLVIDTQRGVRTTLILKRIRHRLFVSAAADFWLSEVRPPRDYRRPPAMVMQLLDLVRMASGRAPRLASQPMLPERFMAAARAAIPEGTPVLGLVPGAGGRHKCWPRERYVELARQATARGERAAFILGPDERAWLDELRAALPEALFPLQDRCLAPDLAASPLYTLAVGQRLAVAVANDCGTAHMLAAVGCRMVSLFGPSSADKFAPLLPDLTILKAQDFGGSEMTRIPLSAVAAVLAVKLGEVPRISAP